MKSNTNTGGPAFPTATLAQKTEGGMTLRDYFAAKAMQAYLDGDDRDSFTYGEWAIESYQMADAMMTAREV